MTYLLEGQGDLSLTLATVRFSSRVVPAMRSPLTLNDDCRSQPSGANTAAWPAGPPDAGTALGLVGALLQAAAMRVARVTTPRLLIAGFN